MRQRSSLSSFLLATSRHRFLRIKSRKLPPGYHNMDNNSQLVSSSPYSWEPALLQPVGVSGDPNLAAGLLLVYFFLGLGSYIWAFWSQRSRIIHFFQSVSLHFFGRYSRLKGVQNIHNFLKILMLIDAVNGVTAVMLAVELIAYSCNVTITCFSVYMVWFLSRYFGLLLQLITALACLFFLCHPQRAARWCCIFSLVLIFALVFVLSCIITSMVLPDTEMIFGMGAVMYGLALALVTECAVSTAPPSTAIHKKPVVIVAVVTVLLVYTPTFVLHCLLFSSNSKESTDKYRVVYTNVLFFTNFHLFMDGLLSYFILRVPVEEEEQQQQARTLEVYSLTSV